MIRGDIAIKALSTLAEQARFSVKFMSISSINPNDLAIALKSINDTTGLLSLMLERADEDNRSPQAQT
jgi:hypothetical protein